MARAAPRRPRIPTLGILCSAALTGLLAAQVDAPRGLAEHSRRAMGARFSILVPAPDANDRAAAEAALDEVERIDRLLSTWREDSFVAHVNRAAHRAPVRLDAELEDLLARSLALGRDTDGAFDVTVGPLVRAYGFLGGEPRLVPAAELAPLRRCVGAEAVLRLDATSGTLRFLVEGAELDFGAIGKGFAVDAAVRVLRAHGVGRALVEGGTSTVYGLGAPPDRPAGWAVALRHPRDAEATVGSVTLRDRALSVSGDWERCFFHDGVRYSHVLDPRTGRPVAGMAMAAAVAATATTSDALATAFFVLRAEGTRAFLQRHPDISAIVCATDAAGAPLPPIHLDTPETEQSHD